MARVLVVDDSPDDREIFRDMLEKLGHDVVETGDGDQVPLLARQTNVDLILLDRNLVGFTGEQILKDLKRDAQLRTIPVLIVTSEFRAEKNANFITLGADDYLSKDADPALFRARVTNCIERKRLQDQQRDALRSLQEQKEFVRYVLNALLPNHVVSEIIDRREIKTSPQRYDSAAVMFCDIVNFTSFCEQHPSYAVLEYLDPLVHAFEDVSREFGLTKIKTIGDSYMATAGMLGDFCLNPVKQCIDAGLAMQTRARQAAPQWELRIGIDIGSFVAGIVGKQKFQFDTWGRTVNMAARIESEGQDGRINLSEAAWNQVSHLAIAKVTEVSLKGIGQQQIFIFERWLTEKDSAEVPPVKLGNTTA